MRTTFFAILALAISLPTFADYETDTAEKLKLFEYDKNFTIKKKKKIITWFKYNKHSVVLEGKGPSGKIQRIKLLELLHV